MSDVAIVGLGIMGGAIARHLAAAGFAVTGCDIDPTARAAAKAHGVNTLPTLGSALPRSGVVLLSLASAAAVSTVISELRAASVPLVIADTSTLSLPDKKAMAALLTGTPHSLLDCPISGTGAQMANRDVVIYASGEDRALAQARPFLEAISRKTIPLGQFGNGTAAKLIANYLVAVHNVATAEAMRLGVAAGIDPATLIDAVQSGAGNSRIFELRAPLIAKKCFTPPTMKLSVWAKDMAAIEAFAASLDIRSPLIEAIDPLYRAALEQGLGDLDTAAVALALPASIKKDSQ